MQSQCDVRADWKSDGDLAAKGYYAARRLSKGAILSLMWPE